MSFFQDDFREFMDTLTVALRQIEKAESPIRHIHPLAVREGDLSDEGRCDFGLGLPVREDAALIELTECRLALQLRHLLGHDHYRVGHDACVFVLQVGLLDDLHP